MRDLVLDNFGGGREKGANLCLAVLEVSWLNTRVEISLAFASRAAQALAGFFIDVCNFFFAASSFLCCATVRCANWSSSTKLSVSVWISDTLPSVRDEIAGAFPSVGVGSRARCPCHDVGVRERFGRRCRHDSWQRACIVGRGGPTRRTLFPQVVNAEL